MTTKEQHDELAERCAMLEDRVIASDAARERANMAEAMAVANAREANERAESSEAAHAATISDLIAEKDARASMETKLAVAVKALEKIGSADMFWLNHRPCCFEHQTRNIASCALKLLAEQSEAS